MSKVKIALEKLGEDYIFDLTQRLLRYDKKASGNLINSLDYEVLEATTEIIDQAAKFTIKTQTGLKITSEYYLKYVDEGRKKGGKMPPVSAIQPWVRSRGIKFRDKKGRYITNLQTSFIISKSIQKKGIKPTNVIEETKAAMLSKLNGLLSAYGEEILTGLREVLKNI